MKKIDLEAQDNSQRVSAVFQTTEAINKRIEYLDEKVAFFKIENMVEKRPDEDERVENLPYVEALAS